MGTCKQCDKQFENSAKQTGRQIYCSKYCREKLWRENNKQYANEYARKYRLENRFKKELLCRNCDNPINNELRGSGVVFCSSECCDKKRIKDKHKRIKDSKKTRKEAQCLFSIFKHSIGCQLCKYNKVSACLDFHHKEPEKKEKRIVCTNWKKNYDEIIKCCLVCKNCHYELHDMQRKDPQKYIKAMKKIPCLSKNKNIKKAFS